MRLLQIKNRFFSLHNQLINKNILFINIILKAEMMTGVLRYLPHPPSGVRYFSLRGFVI